MDFWASLEHKLRYKKEHSAEQEKLIQEELYDCSIQSAELDKRMQDIRNMIIKANGDGEEERSRKMKKIYLVVNRLKSIFIHTRHVPMAQRRRRRSQRFIRRPVMM